jgi:hypothetical protein
MLNNNYNNNTLEAVTQGSVVGGHPSKILSLLKTTLLLLSLVLTGCASTNSFNADSKYTINQNESHSQWCDRQENPLKDTFVGSGVNPNAGQNEIGTQWPFGRTGWGTRQFEPSF